MIDICPRCGDYAWNKTMEGPSISCSKCGHSWTFVKLPLFVVTGASGVGKTTAVQALQRSCQDFVCLDNDLFYNIMPHETQEDYMAQTEQMMAFAREIMQCGKPTMWARAGNVDLLGGAYGSRFFSGIYVLALVCGEEELSRRMGEGRGISDPGWLRSSADYNRYFMEHDNIGGVPYDALDVTGLTVDEAASAVGQWAKGKLM